MARLPEPGGDNGVWGFILNEFLEVEHLPDGTHHDASSSQRGVLRLRRDLGNNATNPFVVGLQGRSVASTAPVDGNVLTWNNTGNRWQPDVLPAATTTSSGIVQLTNDFGGNSTSPSVTGIQSRNVANTAPGDGQVLTWNDSLSQWEPQAGGGGGVIPWLVAAADAPASVQAVAGFVCDGTDDQVEINAALAAHNHILLSPGNFDCTVPDGGDCIDVPAFKSLRGAGKDQTYIQDDSPSGVATLSSLIRLRNGTVLGDVSVFADSWEITNAIRLDNDDNNIIIENVHAENFEQADTILANGNGNLHIINSTIECQSTDTADAAIRSTGITPAWLISGTRINGGGRNIDIGDGTTGGGIALDWKITDCVFENATFDAIRINGGRAALGWKITGNDFVNWGMNATDVDRAGAIKLIGHGEKEVNNEGGDDWAHPGLASHNTFNGFYFGLVAEDHQGFAFQNNTLLDSACAVLLDNSDDIHVSDNRFYWCGINVVGSNFPVVLLLDDSNDNLIVDNIFRTDQVGFVTQPEYAIEISTPDCDDNVIKGNDFRDGGFPWNTSEINDLGTGTLIGSNTEWDFGLPSSRTDGHVVTWDDTSQAFQLAAGGGGGSYPFIVAASNSPAEWIAAASYTCDGTNDEVEINQAITDAAADFGSEVILAPGEFYVSNQAGGIVVSAWVKLRGSGLVSTFIYADDEPTANNDPVITLNNYTSISDILLTGFFGTNLNSGIRVVGQNIGIDRIYFVTDGPAIYTTTNTREVRVSDCEHDGGPQFIYTNADAYAWWVRDNYLFGDFSTPAIDMAQRTRSSHITNNYISGCTNAVRIGTAVSTASQNTISDNVVLTSYEEAIYARGEWTTITGNNIVQATWNDVGLGSIRVQADGSGGIVVSDNVIAQNNSGSGIYAENLLHSTISDNVIIDLIEEHGIHLVDAVSSKIENNIIGNVSNVLDNTYDGIFLEGDSNLNTIASNRIESPTVVPQIRYGINISAATCDDNTIENNDLRPLSEFGTGGINDAGTGTLVGSNTEWDFGLPSTRTDGHVVTWDNTNQVFELAAGGGGASGAPTIVVAASDASAESTAKADVVVDGTDDQVEIQQALDDLDTGGVGGRILLTEGTFNLTAQLIQYDGVSLQGMGMNATILDLSGAAVGTPVIESEGNNSITQMRIDANGSADGLYLNGSNIIVDTLQINSGRYAIRLRNLSLLCRVTNCYIVSSNHGIYTFGSDYLMVSDTYIQTAAGFSAVISDLGGCEYMKFSNVVAIAGNGIATTTTGTFSRSEFVNCSFFPISAGSGSAILSSGGSGGFDNCAFNNIYAAQFDVNYRFDSTQNIRNILVGCRSDSAGSNGFQITGGNRFIIDACFADEDGQHGFYLEDVENTIITNSMVMGGQRDAATTYDGIHLAGDSNNNKIFDNSFSSTAIGNEVRYGINVAAATCDDNSIYDNDFLGSGDTGDINDTGTGTRIGSNNEWDLGVPSSRTDGHVVTWDDTSQAFQLAAGGGGSVIGQTARFTVATGGGGWTIGDDIPWVEVSDPNNIADNSVTASEIYMSANGTYIVEYQVFANVTVDNPGEAVFEVIPWLWDSGSPVDYSAHSQLVYTNGNLDYGLIEPCVSSTLTISVTDFANQPFILNLDLYDIEPNNVFIPGSMTLYGLNDNSTWTHLKITRLA